MLNNVQLILFFDIYHVIKLSKNCQVDVDVRTDQTEIEAGAKTTEREIQTELHPIPYNKDEAYVSNLWTYRHKAIELVSWADWCEEALEINLKKKTLQANLRRKKTTSVQTAFSYHKLDIANQRHEKRQKGLQTDSSKEINTE